MTDERDMVMVVGCDVLGFVLQVGFICEGENVLSAVGASLLRNFGAANWTSVVIWTGLRMFFAEARVSLPDYLAA